ncbi:hypothetical protein C2E23DRAFT_801740 [Lenzites betulinus]|nr:hypothetical protein C2E23DRAFT_801740 [Lenzites betulinus]
MNNKHGRTPRYPSDPFDGMHDLARQIEELQVSPNVTPIVRVMPLPGPDAGSSAGAAFNTAPGTGRPTRSSERVEADPPRSGKAKSKAPPANEREEKHNLLVTDRPPPKVSVRARVVPTQRGRPQEAASAERSRADWAKEVLEETMKDLAKSRAEMDRARADRDKARARLWEGEVPAHELSDRFKVYIVPDKQHTTMWDGQTGELYAWSGTLVTHEPASPVHDGREVVQRVSIEFRAVGGLRTQEGPWHAEHKGVRSRPQDNTSHPALRAQDGIVIDSVVGFDKPTSNGPIVERRRFWVPVPFKLFARAEHLTFECRAKVTIQYPGERRTTVHAESVMVGIECLRTERLLAGRPPRG